MLTFDLMGLSPNVLKAIEGMGFETPTPIQEKVIPLFFENDRDIVGLAQTGTGKTAAFGLPIIERIDIENKTVQALILAPTRELCIQITKDLDNYSKHVKGLKVVPVYGGASIDTQMRALRSGAHIIAATPGRMLDLLKRKSANISNLKTLVLDEADEMLNMGFRDDIDAILDGTPEDKRVLLFSATMPKEVARIAKNYMSNPQQITVGTQNAGADNIHHMYYQVHARDRYLALKRIADINPNIYGIVFCRTRAETKDVADKLIKDGYSADALHGDLSQAQRDHVMKRFREKSLQMLVATDVAARGIDVSDITHVINYNLPEDVEIYTHRSGRTGRAGKSGIAISIVNYHEVRKVATIEKIIRKKMEKKLVPTGAEICQKQLFKLIDKMENVEVDEAQIEPFMESVNKKLEWLDKEQIIKRFVSLEFNRFIEYYKNAPDLNKKAETGLRDTGGRGGRNRGERRDGESRGEGARGRNRSRGAEEGFSRIFINIGKKDGLMPKEVIGLINEKTKSRNIEIGSIDLKDSFSFFEVEEKAAEKVLSSLSGSDYNGRDIAAELAAPRDGRGRERSGSRERSGGRERSSEGRSRSGSRDAGNRRSSGGYSGSRNSSGSNDGFKRRKRI